MFCHFENDQNLWQCPFLKEGNITNSQSFPCLLFSYCLAVRNRKGRWENSHKPPILNNKTKLGVFLKFSFKKNLGIIHCYQNPNVHFSSKCYLNIFNWPHTESTESDLSQTCRQVVFILKIVVLEFCRRKHQSLIILFFSSLQWGVDPHSMSVGCIFCSVHFFESTISLTPLITMKHA